MVRISTVIFVSVAVVAMAYIVFLYCVDAGWAHADVVNVHMTDTELNQRFSKAGSSREEIEEFLFNARVQRGAYNQTDRSITCVLYEHHRMPFVPCAADVGVVVHFNDSDRVSRISVERPAKF